MSERLSGKSAVVTGAASGMGKAIAIAYLKEGANVVAADFNEVGLVDLTKEVSELGLISQFQSVKCDITIDDVCANAVQVCVDSFGTCNVLSSNAGISDDF